MIKVLFICHGNICRSPMGEFILKKMVKEKGLADKFEIASAATSTEEIGNPVYPPAKRKLKEVTTTAMTIFCAWTTETSKIPCASSAVIRKERFLCCSLIAVNGVRLLTHGIPMILTPLTTIFGAAAVHF